MITIETLPMDEAIEFWRDKLKLSPSEYARLPEEARVRAFAVSGIAKGAELDTVFQAMMDAIAHGTTLEDFKAQADEVFDRRGWTGERAWRVDNIFRTNIQTAYNVGRYRQMQQVADARPYWQYSAVMDSRTRQTHRALHGKVFPATHEFWDKWYPPNGFNCRCSVITLSESEVAREGLTVESDDPTYTPIEPVDPITGEKLPAVPLMPDRGFDTNPGKSVWGGHATTVISDSMQYRYQDMPNLKTASDYGRRALENVRYKDISPLPISPLPAGLSAAQYRAEFMNRYGMESVLTDAIGDAVIVSERLFETVKGSNKFKYAKPGHGEVIPLIADMIKSPFELWLVPQKDSATGRIRLTKRYIGMWTTDTERIGGLTVFEIVNGVFQGVSSFLPMQGKAIDWLYLNRMRRGVLLYPR